MGEIGSTHSSAKPPQVAEHRLVVYGIAEQRTADDNQRALRLRQHVREAIEVLGARTGQHARSRLIDLHIGGFVEQILWQDHGNRPRRPALCQVKGTGDCFRGLFGLDHFDY